MDWTRDFLKHLEQELKQDAEDSIFLEQNGENPDILRLAFSIGDGDDDLVVMDVAVYRSDEGIQLLTFYTVVTPEVRPQAVPGLLEHLNGLTLPSLLGAFGYFDEEHQVYHKYSLIVAEPADMEQFTAGVVSMIALILTEMECYAEDIREAAGY